jgi:L-asparagine transporter-like permease
MTMSSLGGVIGAGLFVGPAPILNQAGPATLLIASLISLGVMLVANAATQGVRSAEEGPFEVIRESETRRDVGGWILIPEER